jgi:hypothetical protein
MLVPIASAPMVAPLPVVLTLICATLEDEEDDEDEEDEEDEEDDEDEEVEPPPPSPPPPQAASIRQAAPTAGKTTRNR